MVTRITTGQQWVLLLRPSMLTQQWQKPGGQRNQYAVAAWRHICQHRRQLPSEAAQRACRARGGQFDGRAFQRLEQAGVFSPESLRFRKQLRPGVDNACPAATACTLHAAQILLESGRGVSQMMIA